MEEKKSYTYKFWLLRKGWSEWEVHFFSLFTNSAKTTMTIDPGWNVLWHSDIRIHILSHICNECTVKGRTWPFKASGLLFFLNIDSEMVSRDGIISLVILNLFLYVVTSKVKPRCTKPAVSVWVNLGTS